MNLETLLAIASGALERQGARLIAFSDDDVTVESGLGMRKRRAEVPLAPVVEWLEANTDRSRAGVASYFRGVGAVALEPRLNRREASIDFAGAAGKMMPSLEGPLFRRGAQLAVGDEDAVFGNDTVSDLFIAMYLETDTGRRLLTESIVADWDVSAERVEKAATSVLFHRSYEVEPAPYPLEGVPGCATFALGDSYDASRLLILDTLLYQRALRGLLTAVPSCDRVLLVDLPQPSSGVWDALQAHVDELYEGSAWPLSRSLYTVQLGPPQEVKREGAR